MAKPPPPKKSNRKGTPPPPRQTSPEKNLDKPTPGKFVDLNFKVSPEFKKAFRRVAFEEEITHKELLERAFRYYTERL